MCRLYKCRKTNNKYTRYLNIANIFPLQDKVINKMTNKMIIGPTKLNILILKE